MMKEKSLVLYKGRPAVVIGQDDKISLLLPGGEKIRVRDKDIEALHPGPIEKPESAERPVAGDIVAAWELLQGGGASLAELAELAYGAFTPQTVWAAYLELKDGLRFGGNIDLITAKSPEFVAEEDAKRREKARAGIEREEFLNRLRTKKLRLPEDGGRLQDVEALAYGKSDRSRTLKDLGKTETPETAHSLLLELGIWTDSINPHPSRFALASGDAKTAVPPPPPETRLDLTGLRAFAIDNEWSADPDDAVSFDGDSLWVHVADPAAAILSDSEADREARGRGETFYLPEGISRMLGEGALEYYALGLSEVSPALSFQIKLDGEAAISEIAIHKTLVRVERLTYGQADIRAADPDLAPLFALGDRLTAQRRAAGAVEIDLPEAHIVVRNGDIIIEPITASRAADLVRECMVAAGRGAAKWALRRRLPFPYVSQETGDLPSDRLPGYAGSYQLRRCMRPRRLSAQIGAHAGLGVDEYTQVTSPLRRYTDLIAHQQIRLALDDREPLGTDDILARVAAGEAAAQAAVQAERASRLHWTLAYLLRHPNDSWDAVVVERKGARATILIPALAMEGQTVVKGDPVLNDIIRVKVENIRLSELTAGFTAV